MTNIQALFWRNCIECKTILAFLDVVFMTCDTTLCLMLIHLDGQRLTSSPWLVTRRMQLRSVSIVTAWQTRTRRRLLPVRCLNKSVGNFVGNFATTFSCFPQLCGFIFDEKAHISANRNALDQENSRPRALSWQRESETSPRCLKHPHLSAFAEIRG